MVHVVLYQIEEDLIPIHSILTRKWIGQNGFAVACEQLREFGVGKGDGQEEEKQHDDDQYEYGHYGLVLGQGEFVATGHQFVDDHNEVDVQVDAYGEHHEDAHRFGDAHDDGGGGGVDPQPVTGNHWQADYLLSSPVQS